MNTTFRIVYKNKNLQEVDEQIKETIKNSPNSSKDISQFIKIVESLFSDDIVKIEEVVSLNCYRAGKIANLTEEDTKNLLNIIRKSICLEYEEHRNAFDSGQKEANKRSVPNYLRLCPNNTINLTYKLSTPKDGTKESISFEHYNTETSKIYTIGTEIRMDKDVLKHMLKFNSKNLTKQLYKKAFIHLLAEIQDTSIDAAQIPNGSNLYSLKDLYELKSPKDKNIALIDYAMELACNKKDSIMELINITNESSIIDKNQAIKDLIQRHNLSDIEFKTLASLLLYRKEIKTEIDIYNFCADLKDILAMEDKKTFKNIDEVFLGIKDVIFNLRKGNNYIDSRYFAFYIRKLLTKDSKMYFEYKQLTSEEKEGFYNMFLDTCKNMHTKLQDLELNPSQAEYINSEVMDYLKVKRAIKMGRFYESLSFWIPTIMGAFMPAIIYLFSSKPGVFFRYHSL